MRPCRPIAAASRLARAPRPTFSQTLNLANLQLRFGRPADALATLEGLGAAQNNASTYGGLVLRSPPAGDGVALGLEP